MDGTCVVVACDGETVKIELDDIKKAHIVPTYEF
jgi:ribosome maturation factor RimP